MYAALTSIIETWKKVNSSFLKQTFSFESKGKYCGLAVENNSKVK